MILLSHPTGNNFVRALLANLERSGELSSFQTTLAVRESDWYVRLAPHSIKQELLRRTYNVSSTKIFQSPLREIVRLGAPKFGGNFLTAHEKGWASVDAVYGDLDRQVAQQLKNNSKEGLSAVYCYEDGALHTFQAAKQLGLKCFYDLPIGYWRVGQLIQQEEAKLNPDWADTLTANFDSAQKLARKDEELQLADAVFVASSFTKQTLQKLPQLRAPIVVVPYGAPPVTSWRQQKKTEGKLRVLFVGSLGQRKGLSYLLDGVSQLGDRVELTLIGRPTGFCSALEQALSTHRWIASLPHQQVLAEMSRHDVLVFPSLFEGFGLVILEAMSQGLPVITTPHTGGADVITDGEDGFIVPIRSGEAIAQKLELLAGDRDLLLAMSQAAQKKAARYSWENYGQRIVSQIQNLSNSTQNEDQQSKHRSICPAYSQF